MPYLDSQNRPASADTALDASGRIRPGFHKAGAVADGEYIRFDVMACDHALTDGLMMHDGTNPLEPFVSPASRRQQTIADDAARTSAARRIVHDQLVRESIAETIAERASGASAARTVVDALRMSRSETATPSAAAGARAAIADNSSAVAAIRAARYL